jgi:molybdopterin-guanine dinucleotide biosynthesis protein A
LRLLGAVLAGGASRRFGSDKAEALLGGKRLIDHAGAALAAWCDDVIVVGRADPEWISVPDAPLPGLGPLGGLCGALAHARLNGFDAVLTMPCDVSSLPDTVAAALIEACPAVVAEQPVIGCWPAALGERLAAHLAGDGRRAVGAWVELADARRLDAPPLPNINTPDALRS